MACEINTVLYRRTSNLYQMETCAVCQENFKRRTKVVELACGHIFHPECSQPLDDCAFCRTPINATKWLMKGNYKEESAKYLQELAEEEADNPVEQVRQFEAAERRERNRQEPLDLGWYKITVIACMIFGLITYVLTRRE